MLVIAKRAPHAISIRWVAEKPRSRVMKIHLKKQDMILQAMFGSISTIPIKDTILTTGTKTDLTIDFLSHMHMNSQLFQTVEGEEAMLEVIGTQKEN